MTEQRSDAAERAVLRCAGLAKRFGSVQAVEGFDLDVGPSEILALLGPSGCGKTTALRLIAGFEQPDAGRITIRGHEMSAPGHNDPPERRRVGLVFQDFALFPHMTVAENVRFGMQERTAAGQTRSALARRLGRAAGALGGGTERAGADDRVGNLLRLVALEAFGERYPHELSGGEAQRVALARRI